MSNKMIEWSEFDKDRNIVRMSKPADSLIWMGWETDQWNHNGYVQWERKGLLGSHLEFSDRKKIYRGHWDNDRQDYFIDTESGAEMTTREKRMSTRIFNKLKISEENHYSVDQKELND